MVYGEELARSVMKLERPGKELVKEFERLLIV